MSSIELEKPLQTIRVWHIGQWLDVTRPKLLSCWSRKTAATLISHQASHAVKYIQLHPLTSVSEMLAYRSSRPTKTQRLVEIHTYFRYHVYLGVCKIFYSLFCGNIGRQASYLLKENGYQLHYVLSKRPLNLISDWTLSLINSLLNYSKQTIWILFVR